MQAYEGYFENGRFYAPGKSINTRGRKRAFITILDEPPEQLRKKPLSESRGIFKGKVRMSADFDEPLDEMKEYMQ